MTFSTAFVVAFHAAAECPFLAELSDSQRFE
jgi:hypothetical protein